MQVNPRISPAGALATAFALVAIASPLTARASFGRTVQLRTTTSDGRAMVAGPSLLTFPSAHNPTGLTFGNPASRYTAPDRAPILHFTLTQLGTVDDENELIRADGLAFDGSGNFFVAHFSAKSIVKFAATGPIDVFDAAEFAPLPSFTAVGTSEPSAFHVPVNPLDLPSKPQIGPIPEPAGIGILTAVALLGVGASLRLRRPTAGSPH